MSESEKKAGPKWRNMRLDPTTHEMVTLLGEIMSERGHRAHWKLPSGVVCHGPISDAPRYMVVNFAVRLVTEWLSKDWPDHFKGMEARQAYLDGFQEDGEPQEDEEE